jgi:RES domain-containing protein
MSSVTLWRIACDTPQYSSDSLSGKGAEITGGRWNRKGTPLMYLASSISLACLETLVHLSGGAALPLNRYLIRVDVPPDLWAQRTVFDETANMGWNSEPAGVVSLDWGTKWAHTKTALLADLPSVIVPEERNLLLNPTHPDSQRVTSKKVRKWLYDIRLISNDRRTAVIQPRMSEPAPKTSPRRKK